MESDLPESTAEAKNLREEEDQSIWWLIVVAVSILIALLAGSMFLPRYFPDDLLTRHFGTVKFRTIILSSTCLMVILVTVLIWHTLEQNKKQSLGSTKAELQVVLQNTMERYESWIESRLAYLTQIGRDPELVDITRRLLAVTPNPDTLKQSEALAEVRNFIKKRESGLGNIGFFIINRD